LAGEYYYVVQRAVSGVFQYGESVFDVVPEGMVHIVYLPAYYRDCGYEVAWDTWGDHNGDSEFIGLEVGYDAYTNHWYLNRALLSGHCGDWRDLSTSSHCLFREAAEMGALKPLGAPIVLVAEQKHANYPSYPECELGGSRMDTCANSTFDVRYPIVFAWQNMGSRTVPGAWSSPCPHSTTTISWMTDPQLTECIWDNSDEFKGWRSANGSGAAPYGAVLSKYFRF
jgi:hypothetical protein